MRRIIFVSMLSFLIASTAALAQDETTTTSQTTTTEVTRGYATNELAAFRPQVGVLSFRDPFSNTNTARFAAGFTVEANFAPAISSDWSSIYIGPETGLIYSHLGDPNTGLLGGMTSDMAQGNAGSNLLLIPIDLKLGYNVTDNFRISAHGGGNAIYRSVPSSIFLGSSTVGAPAGWNLYPNVGGDVELGLSNTIALGIRPDWTITPGDSIFTGTVALNILLG